MEIEFDDDWVMLSADERGRRAEHDIAGGSYKVTSGILDRVYPLIPEAKK